MTRSGFQIILLFMLVLSIFNFLSNTRGQDSSEFTEPTLEDIQIPADFDLSSFQEEDNGWGIFESLEPIWISNGKSGIVRENNPLNPDDKLFEFSETELSSAIDLDWNPEISEALSLRSRAVMQYHREDEEEEMHVHLFEVYLQWQNSLKTQIIDLGKEKIKWGSGYAWNPTQLLIFPDSDIPEPFEDSEGIGMLKMESAYDIVTVVALIADLNDDDVSREDRYQSAIKVSFDKEPWDISFMHHQAKRNGWSGGISFSGLLTDALEFHGEWSRAEFRDRLSPVKESDSIDTSSFYLPARYGYSGIDQQKNYDQILIGGQYTFAEKMNIIFEFYKTTHGYNQQEWDQIKDGIDEALTDDAWDNNAYPFTTSQGNPYAAFLKNTMAAVDEGQLRQHYLFLRYTSGKFGSDLEWEQILLVNLDDDSQMHQLILHKTWWDLVKSNVSCLLFNGEKYSEYGLNPYREQYRLEVEIRF